MNSTLTTSLEDLIKSTEPCYGTAATPHDGDVRICESPEEVGRMFALRVALKAANRNGASDSERVANLLALDELDKRIQRRAIMAAYDKDPAFVETHNAGHLKVTKSGRIVYRRR